MFFILGIVSLIHKRTRKNRCTKQTCNKELSQVNTHQKQPIHFYLGKYQKQAHTLSDKATSPRISLGYSPLHQIRSHLVSAIATIIRTHPSPSRQFGRRYLFLFTANIFSFTSMLTWCYFGMKSSDTLAVRTSNFIFLGTGFESQACFSEFSESMCGNYELKHSIKKPAYLKCVHKFVLR